MDELEAQAKVNERHVENLKENLLWIKEMRSAILSACGRSFTPNEQGKFEDHKNKKFKRFKVKEMKVYCSNCKWYKDDCNHPNYLLISDTWYRKGADLQRHKLAREINQDNNCPDYKRKWWKLWVPK